MLSPEILIKNLNPSQKKAVETLNGPLLILAGAGSGKTRVLTNRMVNMIAQGLAAPDEILCVTFTNKAAREMESRIFKLLSDVDFPIRADLWISTFHSFCVRVLRKNLELLDYKPFFTIYDSSDQLSVVKKTLQALNINDKMFPPKNFLGRISNAKMLGLTPETIEKNPRGIMDRKSLEVYVAYEAELKKANALDFDDLLLKTHLLFQMYPDLLKEYQNKFKYILVDEYQDTNHIQYLLVQMLAKAHRNLAVVGDEDQSIYSWRGADITNILNFEKDFPEAVVIKLEENYRSSGNIVKAATAVIKNNLQRKDKTLFTSNEDGSLIRIREEKNEYDEARFAAKTMETLLNEGQYAHNDFAVFYRTNAQSRVIEEQLRTLGIPYKIVGGVRFYERMEIKDILGYLKLSLNPADDLSFKRIINVPTRGIGKTTVEKLEEFATTNKLTLMDALPLSLDQRLFNAGTTGKLRRFFELMTELKSSALEFKIHDFYHIVLERSGYLVALKKDESPEAQARIKNLEELDNAISQFVKERGDEGTLQSFLEEMALVSEADNLDDNLNSVTLMTLHISKGLEYPNVFIVGMEENLFPSRSYEEGSNEEDLEEERRLAYVGMTRARENLWLTYAQMRRVWGQEQKNQPSRFIKEIPKELSEFKSSVESGGGFFQRHSSRDTTDYGFGQYNNKASFHSNFDNDVQRFPEDEERSGSSSQYAKGTQVRHPTFGVGSVFSTEGDGEQLKVSILFADQTIKKFVVKYARLEKV